MLSKSSILESYDTEKRLDERLPSRPPTMQHSIPENHLSTTSPRPSDSPAEFHCTKKQFYPRCSTPWLAVPMQLVPVHRYLA